MRRQLYGPNYVTTASDRAQRMASRCHVSDEGLVSGRVGASHAETGNVRINHVSPPPTDSFRAGHVTFVGEEIEHIANNVVGDLNMSNSDCLLDLDNDVLEQAVHSRSHLTFDSTATDYVTIDEGTFRDRRSSIRAIEPRVENNAMSSNFTSSPRAVNHEQIRFVAPVPANQLQGNFVHQGLSKTDSIVIMELLRKLKDVDASNEFELVTFLKDLMPIFNVSPSHDNEIIKLLLPKVKGQLFQLWIESVSAQSGWNNLHVEILDRFIPSMRRREIESIELDRPQRIEETFSDYCEHLLSTAFALKTNLSENDVIEIALNKCRPETKSHFSFDSRPRTIQELRRLATRVTSAVRAETRYFGPTIFTPQFHTPPPQIIPSQRPRQPFPRRNDSNDLRNRPAERIIKCFRCNQEGHLARNCRSSLNW